MGRNQWYVHLSRVSVIGARAKGFRHRRVQGWVTAT